jgi:hypothetical protein
MPGDSRGDDGRGVRSHSYSSSREFAVEGGIRAYVQDFLSAPTLFMRPNLFRPTAHCARPVARRDLERRNA